MVRRNAVVEHLDEMSARVFSAFPLFEMRGTMRGAGVDGFGGDRRTRIRANLFGPVDHDEVKRALNNELAEQAKRDAKKYNFDFLAERPTEGGGRYDWDVASTVPAPYELRGMPYIHSHTAEEASTAVGTSSTAALGPSSAEENVASLAASARAATQPMTTPAALKQSRITDYHQKRKRLLTQDKSSSPAAPAPSTTTDQALFKKARLQES